MQGSWTSRLSEREVSWQEERAGDLLRLAGPTLSRKPHSPLHTFVIMLARSSLRLSYSHRCPNSFESTPRLPDLPPRLDAPLFISSSLKQLYRLCSCTLRVGGKGRASGAAGSVSGWKWSVRQRGWLGRSRARLVTSVAVLRARGQSIERFREREGDGGGQAAGGARSIEILRSSLLRFLTIPPPRLPAPPLNYSNTGAIES